MSNTQPEQREPNHMVPQLDPNRELPHVNVDNPVVITRGYYKGYTGKIVDFLPNAHCYIVEFEVKVDNVIGRDESKMIARLPFHWTYVETHLPTYEFEKNERLDRPVPNPWMEMHARIFGQDKNWMGFRQRMYRLTLLDMLDSEGNEYYRTLIKTVLKQELGHVREMFEHDLFMAYGYGSQDFMAIKMLTNASKYNGKNIWSDIETALEQDELDEHWFFKRLERIHESFHMQVELLDTYEIWHEIEHTRIVVDEPDENDEKSDYEEDDYGT